MIEGRVLIHRLYALEDYLADLDEASKDLDWLRYKVEYFTCRLLPVLILPYRFYDRGG